MIIEVCTIEEKMPHPNADKLELIRIKGWWCCSQIGYFELGEKCVYFPPDTVLPEPVAVRLGVDKYSSKVKYPPQGEVQGYRIKAARLRGAQSYGTAQKLDLDWDVGVDVTAHYGAIKYEPPTDPFGFKCGNQANDLPNFHKYTKIENIGNFPNAFKIGEEVIFEEKIHGTNSRVGYINVPGELVKVLRDGIEIEEREPDRIDFVAGSHNVRVKNDSAESIYKLPLEIPGVRNLLFALGPDTIIYGEIFGQGVQDMTYGETQKSYRAFDIMHNGRYLDYDERNALLDEHCIAHAPHLYRGPFSLEKVREYTDGNTTMCESSKAGKFKGREGIVIRPVMERNSHAPHRVILKSISVDYLSRKNATEFH